MTPDRFQRGPAREDSSRPEAPDDTSFPEELMNTRIASHSNWVCGEFIYENEDVRCQGINHVSDWICVWCASRRDVGTLARNKTGDIIGKLVTIRKSGREGWVYFQNEGCTIDMRRYPIFFRELDLDDVLEGGSMRNDYGLPVTGTDQRALP